MSENLEQYVYNDKVFMVGNSPITLKPTGKFPVVAEQQWKTLEDAQSFIDDPNSNAIPGMVLSVVDDPDETKNGVYFVKSIGEVNNSGDVKKGELSILAYTENVNSGMDDIIAEFNKKIENTTNQHDEDVKRIDADVEEAQMYRSNAGDDWKTEAVGGIKKGLNKNSAELTDKKINEVLDMILYPTLQPVISPQPSITLTYNGNSTSGQVICINVGANLPNENNFTRTYNRGSVNYVNSAGNYYYAGEGTETFTMTPNMFGQVSTEGTYTVTYTVDLAPGVELLDNKKGSADPDIRYKGGSLTAKKVFTSVYPIYANTNKNNITEFVSQGAKDYISGNVTLTLSIADEPQGTLDKFTLKVPNYLTVSNIQQYNSNSGKYDIDTKYMLSNKTTESINGITYNVYKRATTTGDFIGAAQYQVTINKK